MTTCIYDAYGTQLCCCMGLAAAMAYLELFQLDQDEVILETIADDDPEDRRPSKADV